jgi:hypothetical protein
VLPEFRGHDLALSLMKTPSDFSFEYAYSGLGLEIPAALFQASELYKSLGFQMVQSKIPHRFGLNLSCEFWELKLDRPSSQEGRIRLLACPAIA